LNIFIIDRSKKILVNLNPGKNYNLIKDSLENSISKKEIIFSNLYYDQVYKDVVIDVYIPVILNKRIIASIIFKIDPHRLLFPIVTSSFHDNTTSESLVLSVEGDSVILLSPSKIAEAIPGQYKRSLNEINLPVVKFIKDNINEIQGTDYRGQEVIANIRKIEKTPWIIVTKVDLTEVYGPVYADTVKNILILGAVIIIGGLALLVYYTVANYNNLKSINEAEKKFKKIFDNSIEAIVIISNNKITDCNPYTCSLLGVPKNSLLGKSLSDFSPAVQPDGTNSAKTISKLIEEAVDDKEQQFEWVFNRSGKLIFSDVNLSNFTVNGKKLAAAFIRDMTQRRIAEESNRKLSRAVEYSPISIVITDIDANIEYVNPKFTNLTGYFPEEVLGTNPKILSSGQTAPSVYKEMWETLKAGETWYGEFCNKKKNGELFWETAIISPIKDEAGKITHFIALKEDITEKKKTTEYLILQSKMLESIGQSVIAIKPDSTIMYQNSTAEKLFGWALDEVIGRNIIEVGVPLEYISEAKQILFKLFNEGSFTGELIVKRKDESRLPVLISGSKVQNERGEIIGFIGVFTDLTEIKRKEAELKLAKDNAEEMNKLKTSFLANMSHELRTPLTGILGFTEILKDEVPDAGQREMVDYIRTSGQRLLSTFNSILDLSSIEANKYKVTYSDINIFSLLQREISLYKSAAEAKAVEIILEAPDQTSTINSDEHILTNIVSNLINNAIKFTNNGKITVGYYFSELFSVRSLNIFVRDTGIGIPDDAKSLIFDEFRQVSEGLGRSYEGSGLGLAITSKFVKMLNGEINVFSKVGLGSEFVVKIPIGQTEEQSVKSQIDEVDFVSSKFEKVMGISDKIRILLVEDDESNSSFILHVLATKYSVDLADNGKTAIKMATDSFYDLILMDINLGLGMDGLLVSKTLRSIDKYASIPIIAITAYAMAGDKAKFLNEGLSDYIAKPFAISELLNIVSKHLKANSVKNSSAYKSS
jgi:PAS domain S-box-containing protein